LPVLEYGDVIHDNCSVTDIRCRGSVGSLLQSSSSAAT